MVDRTSSAVEHSLSKEIFLSAAGVTELPLIFNHVSRYVNRSAAVRCKWLAIEARHPQAILSTNVYNNALSICFLAWSMKLMKTWLWKKYWKLCWTWSGFGWRGNNWRPCRWEKWCWHWKKLFSFREAKLTLVEEEKVVGHLVTVQ